MAQEVLPQYESELAPRLEETDRLDSELLPEQDLQVHVEMHGEPRSHHIEIKEAHACGVDCPEHGDHDHADEHSHEHGHHHEVAREHTIARKPAEHACAPDCPEHGNPHNHEKPHSHHDHSHESQKIPDHYIESKAHVCAADCPEHNHNHDDDMHAHESHGSHQSHPESQPQHARHIESKPHACGVDCPEHGAAHIHDSARAEQRELSYDPVYQKAEEAIRQSQSVEVQTRAIEPSASGQDSGAIHERRLEKSETVKTLFEAERTRQNELQVPEQQPEKESFIVRSSATPETSLASVPPAESPLAFDVVETVETQSGVETVHEAIDQSTEFAATMQLPEVEVVLSVETPAVPGLEQSWFTDVQELRDETMPTARSEISGDVVSIEAIEPLETVGIARVELPMPEPTELGRLVEVYENTLDAGLPNVSAALEAVPDQSQMEQELTGTELMAESLAELVSQRIEAVAEHISTDAPLRAQGIQKTLRTLTELQDTLGAGRHIETSQQLLRLLELLGYENPAQTLKAYIHQYGVDFVSELQLKLLELLSQGRVYESLSASSPSSTATLSGEMSALGMLVLALARVRGHLLAAGGI